MKKMCNIKPFLGLSNSVTDDYIAVSTAQAKTVTTIIRSGSRSGAVGVRTPGLSQPQTPVTGRVIANPLDTRPDILYYHHPHSIDDDHYEVVER